MSTRRVVIGLGAVALIAGCGSGSSAGGAAPPTGISVTPTPTHTRTHPVVTPTASPSPTATVTVTSTPAAAPCSSHHLKLSLGAGQGTAGTAYQMLVLTNTGATSCTLFGYPGASFVDASGAIIGKSSVRDHGSVHTITIAPGLEASALSRQPDAGNFPASVCLMKTADRVRVYPPGQTVPLFVHDPVQVCSTGKGRTGIGPMQAGS